MRYYGGRYFTSYAYAFVISSICHHDLLSLAKKTESPAPDEIVKATGSSTRGRSDKQRQWIFKPRKKGLVLKETKEPKKLHERSKPKFLDDGKRSKKCQLFIDSQQDRHFENLFLPIEQYKYLNQNPKIAFTMALIANFAYWEFHKMPMPESCSGFRLEQDSSAYFSIVRQGICFAKSAIAYALAESNPLCLADPSFQYKCTKKNYQQSSDSKRYNFHFSFYNWYESGVAGVKFHDTDVLILTSNDDKDLVVTFAGTASAADAVTNIQTFEPANHSYFFKGAIQGTLHRGFLNAYSRVDRGYVLRLNPNSSTPLPLEKMYQQFGHCMLKVKSTGSKTKKKANNTEEQDITLISEGESDHDEDLDNYSSVDTAKNRTKVLRGGGCRVKRMKLIDLLRVTVIDALKSGRTVHVSGHSLGGALATFLAGDIIVNHPKVPVGKLHLWTFGAPQIADDIFLESAVKAAPRLKGFLQKGGNGRFHRFVTLSDDCKVDVVAEVAKNTLAVHKSNFHGRSARKFGGLHGFVVHFAEPYYLLTPKQFGQISEIQTMETTTHSTVAAHSLNNYLQGISRESRDHPLRSDIPLSLSDCV